MRKVCTIVFAILFCIAAFLFSCSFPNKASINKANQLNSNLAFLAPLMLAEFKSNISFSQTYKVKTDTLRKYLLRNGITEVSVQYYAIDKAPKNPIDPLSFDSLVIFHCNKSKGERYIYEDIIYSFAAQKPRNSLINKQGKKVRQLNDSLWVINTDSEVVLTF
jgi:hypothetical protein